VTKGTVPNLTIVSVRQTLVSSGKLGVVVGIKELEIPLEVVGVNEGQDMGLPIGGIRVDADARGDTMVAKTVSLAKSAKMAAEKDGCEDWGFHDKARLVYLRELSGLFFEREIVDKRGKRWVKIIKEVEKLAKLGMVNRDQKSVGVLVEEEGATPLTRGTTLAKGLSGSFVHGQGLDKPGTIDCLLFGKNVRGNYGNAVRIQVDHVIKNRANNVVWKWNVLLLSIRADTVGSTGEERERVVRTQGVVLATVGREAVDVCTNRVIAKGGGDKFVQ